MSIQKILLNFDPEPENLLPAIKKIQKEHKYISKSDCGEIADYFSLPPARIFSLASFFDEVNVRKTGKKTIKVCSGGPCLSEESSEVVRQIELLLKIEAENDAHPKWKLEYVSCLGLCDRGPIIEIDGNVFEQVKPEMVDDIIKNYI